MTPAPPPRLTSQRSGGSSSIALFGAALGCGRLIPLIVIFGSKSLDFRQSGHRNSRIRLCFMETAYNAGTPPGTAKVRPPPEKSIVDPEEPKTVPASVGPLGDDFDVPFPLPFPEAVIGKYAEDRGGKR